ncbi:MAG: hypothetical protein ACFE0Q_13655 [Anaerolineae bacterium]
MFYLLAHAGLGYWDEVFYLGIAVVFTSYMGMAWWRSQDFEADYDDDDDA